MKKLFLLGLVAVIIVLSLSLIVVRNNSQLLLIIPGQKIVGKSIPPEIHLAIIPDKTPQSIRDNLAKHSLKSESIEINLIPQPDNLVFRFNHADTKEILSGFQFPQVSGQNVVIPIYISPSLHSNRDSYIREVNRNFLVALEYLIESKQEKPYYYNAGERAFAEYLSRADNLENLPIYAQ